MGKMNIEQVIINAVSLMKEDYSVQWDRILGEDIRILGEDNLNSVEG